LYFEGAIMGRLHALTCFAGLFVLAGLWQARAAQPDYLSPTEHRRLALVIGNAFYEHFDELRGSQTDATEIFKLLNEKAKFDIVDVLHDVESRDALERNVVAFTQKVRAGDLVLIYYSGHGFSHGGDNYLVPTKAPPSVRPADLDKAFPPESAIRRYITDNGKPAVVIVLLDACRTYAGIVSAVAPEYQPVAVAQPPEVAAGPPNAEAEVGLLEPSAITTDQLLGFAAAPGQSATGMPAGTPSPYTQALLTNIAKEGWELVSVQKEIVRSVRDSTAPVQNPWFSQSLVTEVFLRPNAASRAQERDLWLAALDTGNREEVRKYYDYHRVGPYADAAQRWLQANPTDRHPTFSQVSPLQPELAWLQAGAGPVEFARMPIGVGVDRTLNLSEAKAQIPRRLAEADVRSLLQLHGQARLTERVKSGAQVLSRGVPLDIQATGQRLLANAFPILGAEAVPLALPLRTPETGLRVGKRYAEFVLASPADGAASVVDPVPLQRALEGLKKQKRVVGWVSISTPKRQRARDQDLLNLQAVHAKYLLKQAGVPEAKISVLEAFENGPAVRVRIYAF
jgi:uncharacterized caspase-like protein